MSPYAKKTAVPVERSRAEVEKILEREGAGQTIFARDGRDHVVGFSIHSRQVRFRVSAPDRDEFEFSDAGQRRSTSAIDAAVKQEERRRWRVLILLIKGAFEVVNAEDLTFEEAFLPYIVLPNGKTVADNMIPQIQVAYDTGKMPALIPESVQ